MPEAQKVQEILSKKVSLKDGFTCLRSVAGVDVSIDRQGGTARAAVVILSFPELEITAMSRAERGVTFPYVPGYLSFRETPVILAAFENIRTMPDVVLVDGHGIAHPRKFGIAAHIGVLLDIPTIGCAKSKLCGHYEEPGIERGSSSALYDEYGTRIGDVLRTRTTAKPVFVSPGHKISFESSVRIVLDCAPRFRVPEPLRAAHQAAKRTLERKKLKQSPSRHQRQVGTMLAGKQKRSV